VKGMKILDLRVPANIILAAAILLRLKSDMLDLEERMEETEITEEIIRPPVPVETLSMRLRLAPKRKITLNELIIALEEAMKFKEYKETKAAEEIKIIPILLGLFFDVMVLLVLLSYLCA